MTERNTKAYAMMEGRISERVKRFNHYPVSGDDSDDHYFMSKDRARLARLALDRAPEMKVTTLARSLGDVYLAVRKNLTPEELEQWKSLDLKLEALEDKYGA